MRSKILVRILIVLLAAFLIFRIHQRVETYRVPRELCRSQISILAEANIQHMFEQEGVPAPDLDSLLTYAKANGYFSTTMSTDSIFISFSNGNSRQVMIPDSWKDLWNETAIETIEAEYSALQDQHTAVIIEIDQVENELGFSLDSLISLREMYLLEHPQPEEQPDDDEAITPGEHFDDSLGLDARGLLDSETSLAASVDSIAAILQNFNDVIAPARRDSVSSAVVGICPSLWEAGYFDSLYSYDPKLALGSQFSISCPNIDRHGGVVGGFVEKEFPDSVFMEPDWSETQFVYSFPEYAEIRRLQASRANLIRAAEEEAAYLAQRYPMVIIPKQPENLEVDIDELIDPLGGEYIFELLPDTTYVYYQNPDGRTQRTRGDSVTVETMKFVGYTTADPDTSRVEVFFSHPMNFPSRSEGAVPGSNDKVSVIMYWERSELGTLKIDEREVDLLDMPSWEFISSHFGAGDTTVTE
ncbi:MAG: hypothetical protein JXA64_04120 [Candidatus Fermentibacteraceae bacterium]|nr:hypothetical protein [Candidatus Fermentibacteraceae bacterium]MBN2608278.1 hypothetical protein [Candidatus Fermentibacteraceae bacterium]